MEKNKLKKFLKTTKLSLLYCIIGLLIWAFISLFTIRDIQVTITVCKYVILAIGGLIVFLDFCGLLYYGIIVLTNKNEIIKNENKIIKQSGCKRAQIAPISYYKPPQNAEAGTLDLPRYWSDPVLHGLSPSHGLFRTDRDYHASFYWCSVQTEDTRAPEARCTAPPLFCLV